MALDKYGLRELPKDKRDFQLGALFRLPDLKELPESFEHTTQFPIKNQGNTDFCSAYTSTGMSELQENVELYPEYSFALSKAISGDPDAWGQNLRDAIKCHQKYGSIEAVEALNSPKIADLRRLSAYPDEWLEKAKKHRKQSYFSVTGQYDAFDNIRASIWKFRAEKQAVAIGVIFSWPISQYILDTAATSGYGHAMYVTGWDEDGLIVVNSYGEQAGKNGKHRITREVINAFSRFGVLMMVDMPPEEAKVLIERREFELAGFFKKIFIIIRDMIWK